MSEIEQKALALVNEVRDERGFRLNVEMQREDMAQEALCRAIEQHEAFKREVSEAVADVMDDWPVDLPLQLFIALENLKRFILPKPDPLVEVANELGLGSSKTAAEELRAAIEKRGGKIVWGEG